MLKAAASTHAADGDGDSTFRSGNGSLGSKKRGGSVDKAPEPEPESHDVKEHGIRDDGDDGGVIEKHGAPDGDGVEGRRDETTYGEGGSERREEAAPAAARVVAKPRREKSPDPGGGRESSPQPPRPHVMASLSENDKTTSSSSAAAVAAAAPAGVTTTVSAEEEGEEGEETERQLQQQRLSSAEDDDDEDDGDDGVDPKTRATVRVTLSRKKKRFINRPREP